MKVALVEAGQDRGEVAGVGDGGPARQAQRCAHLRRDDHRQRRLPETGRTTHQHVVDALARAGCLEQQEPPAHAFLADHLVQVRRRRLDDALVTVRVGLGQRPGRPSRRPRSPTRS